MEWENRTVSLKATYEFISNAYVYAELIMSDISGDEEAVELYTPAFFRGDQTTVSFGFNVGF